MERKTIYYIISLILIGIILSQSFIFTAQQNQSYEQIPNTAPSLESSSTYIGPAPSNLKINVIILPQLKYNELASYVQELYTPGSPDYHKFLNSYQIYQNFSVSPITPDVVSYASQFGINVNATSPLFILLKGSISQFEQMFHTQFGIYKYKNMTYFAPVSNVQVPADIAPYISGVLGINNVTIAFPYVQYIKEYKYVNGNLILVNQTQIKIKPNQYLAPCPVQQYSPLQIEEAYNMLPLYKLGFLGNGETIAIVDAYGDPAVGYSLDNFSTYAKIPNPPQFNVLYFNETQLPSPNSGWASETDLDVEYSHTMAPGANILLVYSPYPSNELYAAVAFIVEYHLANVISLSWGEPEFYLLQAGVNVTALDEVFMTAAAEGIQVFVSSGDQGVYDALSGIHSVNFPSSSPYVTSVGGTALYMKGVSNFINATMEYEFQTGWGDYFINATADGYGFILHYTYAGGGGGESEIFHKPSYQSGLSYVNRTDPDIAMDTDPYTGVNVIQNGELLFKNTSFSQIYIGVGGTSLAAPLSAGIAAVIDQYYHNTFNETLGFLNPYLYRLYFMSDKLPYETAFYPTYSSYQTTIAGFMGTSEGQLFLTGALIRANFGNDTGYFATPFSYNFVTGLGSINPYDLLQLITTNGTALKLTGSGYAFSNSIIPMNGQLTVSFWIYPTSYPANYYGIVGNMGISSTNLDSWGIFLASNGELWFDLYNGNSYNGLHTTAAIPLNKWTLVTLTYSNITGSLTFYFNGTIVNQYTEVQAPLKSYNVYIGDLLSGEFSIIQPFNGMISNVQIYDSALNNASVSLLDIAGFYGAPIRNFNIVSWILLDQASGGTIYSVVGSTYTLTGSYNWSYIPSYPAVPQYLGITSWNYNIYSSPLLI